MEKKVEYKCRKQYYKEWYQANKEEKKKYQKRYYAAKKAQKVGVK